MEVRTTYRWPLLLNARWARPLPFRHRSLDCAEHRVNEQTDFSQKHGDVPLGNLLHVPLATLLGAQPLLTLTTTTRCVRQDGWQGGLPSFGSQHRWLDDGGSSALRALGLCSRFWPPVPSTLT